MKTRISKNVMLFLLFAVFAASAQAQVLMATLQHGEETKVYYNGAESLGSALNDAVTGDIITLSSGSFNAKEINKAVKIVGAGYITDERRGLVLTRISGDFTIQIADGDATKLHIEGIQNTKTVSIKGEIKGFNIRRCEFWSVNMTAAASTNCNFMQCNIRGYFSPDANGTNLYMKNCQIKNVKSNSDTASLIVENRYIADANTYNPTLIARNTCFRGCSRSQSCYYTNCFWLDNLSPSGNAIQTNCWTEHSGDVPDRINSNTLTDEEAAKYVGTDGTIIGIWGGEESWVDVPAVPQVVSAEVASKTTADGKLSVKFTVKPQK